MTRLAFLIAAATSVVVFPAFAADMAVKAPPPAEPPSAWDVAVTAGLMSDYNFRGITQSNHQPSVQAGFEPRYNFTKDLQGYVGVSGESIDFPNRAAAEVDFYGGIRPTFGKLSFDFGDWYYYYPGGQCFNLIGVAGPGCTNGGAAPSLLPNGNAVKANVSFDEFYAKATLTANDNWSLGIQEWYSPSVLNSGASGWYTTGNVTFTAPGTWLPKGVGMYVSGDVGYWALGTSDSFYCTVTNGATCSGAFPGGVPYTSYWNWDAGVGFTWKIFTLDLRYYQTNLTKAQCNVFTSDQTATFSASNVTAQNPGGLGSNWCGADFVAKLSVAFGLGALK